ncbi:MAG: biotin attachment protein [Spirochaetia bacterium]|nr:biotin attachment protein [Spirochaetia bacterium]
MSGFDFVTPQMTPKEIIKKVRELNGVIFTSTGMRDAGQSDFKNRLRLYDLLTLTRYYRHMGLFSAECHGGARWHVGVMNRKESPFEEIETLRKKMPNVLLQTLVRETNLWGYRPYPKNIIEYAVQKVDIDIWRCFSFLNDIRNMKTLAEVVMKRGRLFEPAISFTQAEWTTNNYYLKLVKEIVDLCAGTNEIILCIKDMAGVGSPKRIYSLIDAIKQKYPDLVIQYHRHATDGLALPAILSAAKAGVKILDAQEDSLTRFYGQAPYLALQAYLEESDIPVHFNRDAGEKAAEKVRSWIGDYKWAESPFKGFDHTVINHRMPGGAFPSSFEQAEKGGFLQHMPAILKVMSLYNKIIKYFDVTPGSQITWVTCSGIVNSYAKEMGNTGVQHIITLLTKLVIEKKLKFEAMDKQEQEELLTLFNNAPGDFKNLIMGHYGRLPMSWPDDWVYQSAFKDEWKIKIKKRKEISPLESIPADNINKLKNKLMGIINREPTEAEFILYLMHPNDAVNMIEFREKYGETPLVLPTSVWRNGLKNPGDKVEFEHWGMPYCIELLSIGEESDGIIHVVMRINNKTRVFAVETPRAKKIETRMARKSNEIGSPIDGTVWRIGNPSRGTLHEGDIIHKGEEICNLEAMKMENAVTAAFNGKIKEICINLNDTVKENQLLFVIEKEN